MPPKAKDSKLAAPDPNAAAAEQRALMESELVTALLRTRLGRYQAAGEKLAVENFCLADELAKQKLTLADINEFLTTELKARSLAAAQLEERVGQLSTRLAEVQKESQAEIVRVKAEAAAEVAAASTRAAAGDAAAEGSPADAAGQKAQLERTVAELTAALAARQKDFDARLSDMERRHLQEKEKLRKEAAAKIRETKVAMAQLADQHLEASTKRTLVENETMVAELAYHTTQSRDLVAANSMLRNETAELRRQLAVAHKTVQSTARKNLLLQQTIKSILTCLREEARHNAEAAVTAQQQQQQQQYGSGGCCDSPTAVGAAQQQHHRSNSPWHQHQQQEQQQQQPECAGDTDALLLHLEGRILQLTDELIAARQAMAAALQGCLPLTPHVGSQARILLASSGLPLIAAQQERGHAACEGEGTGGSSSRDASPAGRHQGVSGRRQQQRQQQVGPMEAALEDGVAAFVLFCVQQLRRAGGPRGGGSSSSSSTPAGGSSSSSRQQAAGSQQAADRGPGAAGSSSMRAGGRQAAARGGSSQSGSPSAGSRAAAAAVKGAAAAAGGSGGCLPGSKNIEGAPAGAAAAAGGAAGAGEVLLGAANSISKEADSSSSGSSSGDGGGCSDAPKQLARLLLEQLHSYSRHSLAAYDGLTLVFGDRDTTGGSSQQQQQQQQVGGASGHAGRAAGLEVQCWPAVPLQVQEAAAVVAECLSPGGGQAGIWCGTEVAAGISSGCCVGVEECSAGLQLPPLPCLLNNMGRGSSSSSSVKPPALAACGNSSSSAAAAAATDAAAAAVGCAAGRSPSPGGPRPDRGTLFCAVLSELRPWGAAAGPGAVGVCCGSSTAAAAGALTSPKRSGAAAAGGGLFGRSKTPTPPGGGAGICRGSPGSGGASRPGAAQH